MQLHLAQSRSIKSLLDEFGKVSGKKVLQFLMLESDLTDYLQLYADLAR